MMLLMVMMIEVSPRVTLSVRGVNICKPLDHARNIADLINIRFLNYIYFRLLRL